MQESKSSPATATRAFLVCGNGGSSDQLKAKIKTSICGEIS
jgi:hypothetical protein